MTFDPSRLMLSAGIVSEAELQRAREAQAIQGGSLPRICHDLGALDEARWARVVAKALSLPTIDLDSVEVDGAALGKAPDSLLRELVAFPFQLRDDGRVLGVAMAEPQDDVARAQLRAATGCELEIGVAGYGAIERALTSHSLPAGVAEPTAPAAPSDSPTGIEGFEAGQVSRSGESRPPLEGAEVGGGSRGGPEADQARRLEALSLAAARSASALRAAIDLCVGRRLFTPDDLRARLNRKS
jgi:hypothetical protein